jgi:hypothetical protein
MDSHVAQLIRFFAQRVPGAGRTHLVKFLYLADLEARRYLGKPLTPLRYRWDHFGPFDPEILRQIERLETDGFLMRNEYEYQGTRAYSYTATDRPFPLPAGEAEMAILEMIVARFGKMPLKDLLDDVVYQTPPMRDVERRGQRLRMELVDNEARIPGAELEVIYESMDQVDRGEVYPLEAVVPELFR